MINNFIYNDISNAILNTTTALNEIISSISSTTAKPYFIYAYSLFESTITEIIRYYIKAFPYKIDKTISVNKDLFLTSPRASNIIDAIIDQNIRKYSSQSLYAYIQFFISIQDLDLSLNEHKIKDISDLRNSIVHDDIKNSLIYKHTNNTKSYNQNPPISLYENHICYFIEILDLYNTSMGKKYYEYTLDKLARAIWEYTFSTPVLPFDAVWEYHSEGYLTIKDIDDLKSRATSLSKSEHLFLAIFLQQYNNDLNNYIHDFNKIPSLVSIDKYNKAKLVELIDFFDSFPLLFNGERIKPT